MTTQTLQGAALSDADILHSQIMNLRATSGAQPGSIADICFKEGHKQARHAAAEIASGFAADRRLTAEQGGAASDRKLFEALSKYIHCVLQELQFERGTGSLAAHNLRLCLIEVDKALRGERDSAMNVGVGFPLEGVVAALTTQPQGMR